MKARIEILPSQSESGAGGDGPMLVRPKCPHSDPLPEGEGTVVSAGLLLRTALLLVFGLCLLPGRLVGADLAGPGPVRFQRVHVPADRLEKWGNSGGRYLPMDAADFERLVRRAAAFEALASPRIVQAEYRASLTDGGLLEGTARLQIESPAGRKGLLSLGSASLAIEDAHWQDPRKTTTVGQQDRGDVHVLVEESGRLQFHWSLAGDRGEGNTRQFTLRLPSSPRTTLALDLPGDVTATCDPGIHVDTTPGAAGRKSWRFALGGRQAATLRLAKADAAVLSGSQAELYQSLVYDLSQEGIEVRADLRIEGSAPPARVSLLLDSGLELVTARFGQTPVSWSVLPASADSSACNDRVEGGTLFGGSATDLSHKGGPASRRAHGTHVVVDLPEALRRVPRVLHVAALCPLVLDRPWRLPRIRPQGMFWREGSATLVAPALLCVERLRPIDGRQSRLASLPAPGEGEKTEFQYFSPDATIELLVSPSCSPLVVDYGANIELDGSEVTTELTATFEAGGRERFELEARIDGPWIIDAVSCGDSGVVRDWLQSPDADGGSRLVIWLAKALKPGRDALKITVVGRRLQSPLGRRLSVRDLTPMQFASSRVQVRKRLLAIRARAPYELVLHEDEHLQLAAAEKLDEQTRQLLPADPGGLVFFHDSRTEDLRVELTQRRPGYACDVGVTATVSGRSLVESYCFRCFPRSSQMDRVLIDFSPARIAPLEWRLDTAEGQPLAARRLNSAEQGAGGVASAGETWEVLLLPTRSEPFTIYARRVTPLRGTMGVCLASAREANSQTGRVVVVADEAASPVIVNRRLDPAATEPAPPGQYQSARATFRYRPEQIARSPAGDALTVAVDGQPDYGAPAFAWRCRIDSRFDACGGVQHLATYWVENAGRVRFCVMLPPSSRKRRIHEVWIDGAPGDWRRETAPSGDERLVIDLPRKKRLAVVAVDFSEDYPALGLTDVVRPPRLTADLPVLATHWVAWIPASHRAISNHACWWFPREKNVSWRQRLFGPLGRPGDTRAFNPLAADDWAKLNPLATASRNARTSRLRDAGEEALDEPSFSPGNAPGCVPYCMELDFSRPVPLRIVYQPGIELIRWIAFLVAVGLGMWTSRNHPARLAVTAAGSALLAVLLPAAPAAAASGSLLGMLLCLAAWPLRRRRGQGAGDSILQRVAGDSHRRSLLTAAGSLRILLLVAFVLGFSAAVLAAEPLSDAEPNRDRQGAVEAVRDGGGATLGGTAATGTDKGGQDVRGTLGLGARGTLPAANAVPAAAPFQVLIPVDEHRKPSGGNVLVPELLYRCLTRQAAAGRSVGWLIERATYRGKVAWDATAKRLVPGQMRACFHIRVFDSPARVRIPLAREHLSLATPWAFLDGRAIEPVWEPDGRALVLAALSEGYYRLEVVFTPVMRTAAAATAREPLEQDERGFDIGIPPVPDCRVELALPANAPPIEVPSAQGCVVVNDQRLSARLGGTNQLSVRWQADAVGRVAEPVVEADQLLWLKITPGAVLVDARFRFHVAGGRVSELRLMTDPRLIPLGDPSLGRFESEPGAPGRLRVRLPALQSDHFTLAARFSLQDTSGVGHHRVPLVTADGARITGRRFAVSVDDSLQWTERMAAGASSESVAADQPSPNRETAQSAEEAPTLESVAVPDFLAAWGNADATARAAYRHHDPVPPWSIETRPRDPRTVVDQQLTASFAQKEADLRYEAWMSTSAGYGFRYRIRVPSTWDVNSLAVREDGVDSLARWCRAEDGSIEVLLAAPAAAQRHLVMLGHLSVPSAGNVELSIPVIEDAQLRFSRVTLLRQPPVLLELERCEGLEEAEPESLSADQSLSHRLFVSLIGSGRRTPRVRLRVTPNPPRREAPRTMAGNDRAAAPPPGEDAGTASVSLADVRLAWREDGMCRGTVQFDLDGGGQAWCPLLVPSDYRIVQLTVDGVPTSADVPPEADSRHDRLRLLRKPLGSPLLPARIAIAFMGRLPGSLDSGACAFAVPRLGDLPVEKTIWTLVAPAGFELTGRSDSPRPALDVLRAESFLRSLELAAHGKAETSDKLAWARARTSRFCRLQSALKGHLGGGHSASANQMVGETLGALRRQWSALGEQVADAALLEAGESSADPPCEPAEVGDDPAETPRSRSLVVVGHQPLAIGCRRTEPSWAAGHLPAVLVLCAMFVLGYLAVAYGAWQTLVRRWPGGVVIGAGVAWWLWLVPSAAGLAVVLAGLWLTVHPPGLQIRPADSAADSAM